VPANEPHRAPATGRLGGDATVTAWAIDPTATRSKPVACGRPTSGASGYVDFDVVDTIRAAPRTTTRAVDR
jgi:hypothetical protein